MTVTTEKDSDTQAEKPEVTTEDTDLDEVEAAEVEAEPEDTEDAVSETASETDFETEEETDEGDIPFGRRSKKAKRDKTERPQRRWGQYLRRGAMPLLLAASLAVSGFLGWMQWQQYQAKEAGQQAQQAAVKYAQVLTSIDSTNVEENFRQVLDGATGEFKDMYTQSSVQLRQLLIDNKATAHGVVVDSAIASESANKVVVLVFIDQTVANMAAPDPRIDRSRIKITMEKIDGRWRASKVQLL